MENQNSFSNAASGDSLFAAQKVESEPWGLLSHMDQLAWLQLIRDRRWTLGQKRQLLAQLQDVKTLFDTPADHLAGLIAAKPKAKVDAVKRVDIETDQRWLERPGHDLITLFDARYPALLREIHDPPIAVFVKGNLSVLQEPKVAMVGSRRPTPVGTRLCNTLSGGLAELGVVVTSGMALGIDGAAHQAALDAQANTIAVMACGLDEVYPARHRTMFKQIADQGCLLSEYPLGVAPTKYSFPQRNRIVSGLSLGVIIIEAAQRSGTLITARLAMEQNRQVMVVPGSALSSQYKGSHNLIQQGAAIVTGVEDILHVLAVPLQFALNVYQLGSPTAHNTSCDQCSDNELLQHISYDSTSMDEIIQASGLTSAEVSAMLLALEVNGAVAAADDGGFLSDKLKFCFSGQTYLIQKRGDYERRHVGSAYLLV